MMTVITLPVGQLQSNCYLLTDEESHYGIILDPGDDAEFITQKIVDHQITPVQLVATHGHFDHIMAATQLQLTFNIPFLIHKKDEFLVKRVNETSLYFTGQEAGPPPKINHYLKPGTLLKTNLPKKQNHLKNLKLKIIHTPGHTPGSVCLYSKKSNAIFVGDLIFADGGIGRSDFSYSNELELKKSVNTILQLPKDTIIYPGHGPETTIAHEKIHHK